MEDKSWEQFKKTGRISDYLNYRGVLETRYSDVEEQESGAENYGNNDSPDRYGTVYNADRGI